MTDRPTDTRSPVQPGGGSLAKPLLLAMVAAAAFWSWQQSRDGDDRPRPDRGTEFDRKSDPAPPKSAGGPSRAKANLVALFSTDDYPMQAIRNEEQGTVGFRVDIGSDGRVTDCTVTASSGSAILDRTTCSIIARRARFQPARDASGKPVGDSLTSRVKWVLPAI